jgi:hypothetical protein
MIPPKTTSTSIAKKPVTRKNAWSCMRCLRA